MKRLLALLVVGACGGAPAAPVEVPTQPVATADAGTPATPATKPAVIERGAKALVGPAGAIVPDSVPTLLFVNGAVIRKRPDAASWRSIIVGSLSGWNEFMPTSLIDPIEEIDWVIMGGSLFLGHTQRNELLAHYNVPEKRADAIAALLVRELPKARRVSASELRAEIDGAERVYLRPKAGVLAIVPPSEAESAKEILAHAEVPATVRPHELLRIDYGEGRWPARVPSSVERVRVWLDEDDARAVTLHAEGDCADEAGAEDAKRQLEEEIALSSKSLAVRALLGPSLREAHVVTDGKLVRVTAPVPPQVIELVANGLKTSSNAGP